MGTRKIVIVEDHAWFRDSLRSMLSNSPELEVVGEAADGLEAIAEIEKKQPELILLDLSLPKLSGFLVLREIKNRLPGIKVLVLTIHEADDYVLDAFAAGADGYCLKDNDRREIMDAIRRVLKDEIYVSSILSSDLKQRISEYHQKT